MSDNKRPGGLTALAVFNFIYGGLSLLGVAGLAFIDKAKQLEGMTEEDKAAIDWAKEVASGPYQIFIILGTVIGILLIFSAVGYLKQKRFLGRTLGSTYAVLDLVNIGLAVALAPSEGPNGTAAPEVFNPITILAVLYALLTLYLLNVVFKEDLTR